MMYDPERVNILLSLLDKDLGREVKDNLIRHIHEEMDVPLPEQPQSIIDIITSYDSQGNVIYLTASEVLKRGVDECKINQEITSAEMKINQMERDLLYYKDQLDELKSLQKSINEILDLYELVKDEYSEILADLYLRNGGDNNA